MCFLDDVLDDNSSVELSNAVGGSAHLDDEVVQDADYGDRLVDHEEVQGSQKAPVHHPQREEGGLSGGGVQIKGN